MTLVDVTLKHGVCDFALPGIEPFPVRCVFVNEIARPGSVTSGLTELDALGAFRHHYAFIRQLDISDVDLKVWD